MEARSRVQDWPRINIGIYTTDDCEYNAGTDIQWKSRMMNLEGCTGCRSCELACSFHKIRSFDPAQSSIQVCRDNSTGLVSVVLDNRCDLCASEEEPLCIRFCAPDALNLSVLNELKRNAEQSDL